MADDAPEVDLKALDTVFGSWEMAGSSVTTPHCPKPPGPSRTQGQFATVVLSHRADLIIRKNNFDVAVFQPLQVSGSLPISCTMPKALIWDVQHIDHLERLFAESLSNDQMAMRMSERFGVRITAGNVNRLLQRMRRPSDPFYRNIPYRKAGARRT